MDIIKEYSFDYCWHMAHLMDLLLDHQKSFFAPIPTDHLSAIVAKQPHPAEVDRAWHDDLYRKWLIKLMVNYESLIIPKTIITMPK